MKRSQLEAVELILRLMMQENKPENPAEKLVYDIVYKLYCRIRSRIEQIVANKNGWSIKLGEQEALAMHVFISNFPVPVGYTYESLQLDMIYYDLDRQYGGTVYRDQEYTVLAP
ncbi:hypothetical protein [Sphingobacterium siyangense]|uniref:hypothetical protein n=1 Tax=Sphingobacterium siyangense TaxID=459529 RepID=UPI00301833CD